MQSYADLQELHRRALADATELIARILPDAFNLPTPCAGWDLQALLTHMIVQNDGFAEAVETGDAPAPAYTRAPVEFAQLSGEWSRSTAELTSAFAAAPADRPVRLIEISTDIVFTARAAISMQLLDTAVHAWDVATSIGTRYRPDDGVVAAVAAAARRVPAGEARSRPGAAFAAPVPTGTADPWLEALSVLGRDAVSPAG